MSMELALFVVYGFPPAPSRGTKRTVKFIRYLPRTGWSAVVVTVTCPNSDVQDTSLFSELPADLPVYRARTLENLFHGRTQKENGARSKGPQIEKPQRRSMVRRGVLFVYHTMGKLLSIPDSRTLWLPFAVFAGLRALRKYKCKVIYSSGPSHTNHVVGALLSRFTGRPLVLDFRDAWVANPSMKAGSKWLEKGNVLLERFCVRSARAVVCTTEGIRADFERRYFTQSGKFLTIPNGFDQKDFPPELLLTSSPRRPVLSIVHAGSLDETRSPKDFLRAIGRLLQEKPDLMDKLEVVFVGETTPFGDGRTIKDYAEDYGCGPLVKIIGHVTRKESLDYMVQADILLLIVGRVPKEKASAYGISGKIYDYAAARKPVLTVSEPGPTAELAQRLDLGPVVHPDDVEAIKSAIFSLWQAHHSGDIPYRLNLDLLNSYEFSSLSAGLTDCFTRACQAEPVALAS